MLENNFEEKNSESNSGNKIQREKSHLDKPDSLKKEVSKEGKRSPSREIARPSYEEIEDRRKRIMKSLSDMNVEHSPEKPIVKSEYKAENI